MGETRTSGQEGCRPARRRTRCMDDRSKAQLGGFNMERNIAARAGRWSATHRKRAIWGWLAFVFLAVFIGASVGTQTLDTAASGVGESGRAATTIRGHGNARRRDGADAEPA